MENQIIEHKTAVLAKEVGFDEETVMEYRIPVVNNEERSPSLWKVYSNLCGYYGVEYRGYIAAPEQSLLQKWLREKHNIQIVIVPFAIDSTNENSECKYHLYVNYKQFYAFINLDKNDVTYDSYEEALEIGLYEGLLLIKNK